MAMLGTAETSIPGIGMITIRNVTNGTVIVTIDMWVMTTLAVSMITGATVKASAAVVITEARIIAILGGIGTNIAKTDT